MQETQETRNRNKRLLAFIESSKEQLRRKIEIKIQELEQLEQIKKLSRETRHTSSKLVIPKGISIHSSNRKRHHH